MAKKAAATSKAPNEAPNITAAPNTQSTFEEDQLNHFPPEVIAAAIAAGAKYDAPPSVVLAQAALETGYFKHFPPDSNNYLGMKWTEGAGEYVEVPTREYDHGKWITIHARFRKFANVRDCFLKWGQWVMTTHIYEAAAATWKRSRDPFKTADAIAVHWASDPNYAKKVRDIMATWKLTEFDKKIIHGEPPKVALAAPVPHLPPVDPDAEPVYGESGNP